MAITRLRRHVLPCVLMRAGTSKGIFLHRDDLPPSEADWAPHLISALGSRGCDPRQLDGVGGGTSTTSKVAVVSRSTRPNADVDFTFVQVAVGKETVDFTGNCGNMVSGVGPFAVQEGLVTPRKGASKVRSHPDFVPLSIDKPKTDVRVYNTNTQRVIIETVELDGDGEFLEDGEYVIPGVNNPGSEVQCAFVDPAGSMTGKLLPSGEAQQTLHVTTILGGSFDVRVTLIDAANPFVLIDSTSLAPILIHVGEPQDTIVEYIRRAGAVGMGLAKTVEEAAGTPGTPKVAIVYPPANPLEENIRVCAYSMGLPHPSLQLTGAVCLATALNCQGTVAANLSRQIEGALTPERTPSPSGEGNELGRKKVAIRHSKGLINVAVNLEGDGTVRSCAVSRTARRLFEGKVMYYLSPIV